MRKRVLIITYYWPPAGGSGVQRWVKFAKYLRDFGWEPVIFTAENGDYPIIDKQIGEDLPKNIEVIKSPITEPYEWYKKFTGKKKNEKIDANFLSQGKKMGLKDKIAVWIRGNLFIPDAKSLWIRPASKHLISYLQEHPIDAMISTGPPHSCHMIALRVHEAHPIPWIVDYRDPWTQIDYFDDLHLTRWAENRHKTLEKRVLDTCDAIVAVGKTMAKDLNPITNTKKIVITNGFDDADRNNHSETLDKIFSIVHIGTMNDSRNPEGLWQAISELKAAHHPLVNILKVKLVGKPEAVILNSVKKHNLEDQVDLVGYVSHKEAISYQNRARVLLLMINKTSNNLSILPGKIFEYLASDRPILTIGPENGDAADILLSSGHNTVYDYNNIQGIKQFLEQQYDHFIQNPSGQDMISSQIDRYSRKNLTKNMTMLLDELVQEKSK